MNKASRIYLVAGLGFGDEGKGTMVDYLVRKHNASTVVRYNGGPQAAHHVVTDSGLWHCFAQFGSGTLVPGVKTFLSRKMLISPENMIREELALHNKGVRDAFDRTAIDKQCPIVTILHQMIGQLLELARRQDRHGSCGLGVGQAVLDWEQKRENALIMADILNETKLKEKLARLFEEKFKQTEQIVEQNPDSAIEELWQAYRKAVNLDQEICLYRNFAADYSSCLVDGQDYLAQLIDSDQTLIFEGAQGALLDRVYGFAPYITKTRTNFLNAEELLGDKVARECIHKTGVIRAYSHRHGAGPFVAEDEFLTKHLLETRNSTNPWQGDFRIGWLDLLSIRYGIKICEGIDAVALTNLDRLATLEVRVCTSYEYLGSSIDQLELDKFFEWEQFEDNRIRIKGLKLVDKFLYPPGQFAKLLFDCKPLDFVDFKSWPDLKGAEKFRDLPFEAKEYIEFLQSSEGLNIPISVISIGPTWSEKIYINPCDFMSQGFFFL